MHESPTEPVHMGRKDRLIDLIEKLRDGALHRAVDLAAIYRVSERTLYRDMQTLMQSGVPVKGSRGRGYQMTEPVTLPPLNLTMAELEALHLGLAVMTEAADPDLQAGARALAKKIDAALPEGRISPSTGWGLAVFPFADTAAGIGHMASVRRALRLRRKLRLSYVEPDGVVFESVMRPLKLDYWGRVWTCTLWCERSASFKTLRLDRISALTEMSAEFHKDVDRHLTQLGSRSTP